MLDQFKKGLESAKGKVEETFSDNIALIAQKLESVASQAGKKLDDIWENDEEVTKLLILVHNVMPLPFQLVIREKMFVSIGLGSKEMIKKYLDEYKNKTDI